MPLAITKGAAQEIHTGYLQEPLPLISPVYLKVLSMKVSPVSRS
jgi:hypothetical protein